MSCELVFLAAHDRIRGNTPIEESKGGVYDTELEVCWVKSLIVATCTLFVTNGISWLAVVSLLPVIAANHANL